MPAKRLTLKTLHEFDGGTTAVMFDRIMTRIHDDIVQRPFLKNARKLNLEISTKPVVTEGELEGIEVTMQVNASIPKEATRTNKCQPLNGGSHGRGMFFDPDSRHCVIAPNQPGLFQAEQNEADDSDD
ncbi:hypothetical protein KOR42_39980 [Thalassoglobus neptunius]|uniref:Uncharacterized protein n=1 Tax=Thalassoglobus neptunius TaxID=1938619 RepID=A0A5C5WBF5_9PLAN|nr:hypothetical protein [Thalassoglobus neptunius]TWT48208.1 hypothetical protein KOR42_39980 [Thalassoglobus neptunius]